DLEVLRLFPCLQRLVLVKCSVTTLQGLRHVPFLSSLLVDAEEWLGSADETTNFLEGLKWVPQLQHLEVHKKRSVDLSPAGLRFVPQLRTLILQGELPYHLVVGMSQLTSLSCDCLTNKESTDGVR